MADKGPCDRAAAAAYRHACILAPSGAVGVCLLPPSHKAMADKCQHGGILT